MEAREAFGLSLEAEALYTILYRHRSKRCRAQVSTSKQLVIN